LFRVKNAIFSAEFFGKNILKIITSAPAEQNGDNISGTDGQGPALRPNLPTDASKEEKAKQSGLT
jgi:hypothetical protein